VESLLCKYKAISSNPSPTKKEKKEGKREKRLIVTFNEIIINI
jgi:hypothetical protein